MVNLLSKFRIDFSDMIIIPDLARKAGESTKIEFEELIKDFKMKSGEELEKDDESKVYFCLFVYFCLSCTFGRYFGRSYRDLNCYTLPCF